MKINSDLYHGQNQYTNFFEGWYFKIVDSTATYALAFIPGISRGKDPLDHHCFIQVVNLIDHSYQYFRYSTNEFYSNPRHLKINIGLNEFSLSKINVQLLNSEEEIKGVLFLSPRTKWPDTKFNPGSMGFYNHFSFMECYSQVCALDGTIEEGHLKVNGKLIDFSNGKYYIEKNWGKSFPKSWIWIQSNSFNDQRATLTCSLATIPFPLVKEFRGFIIGVTVDNNFYSFTSINKSSITLNVCDRDIILCATRKHLHLVVKTKTNPHDFVLCYGPKDGEMVPLVEETLLGEIEMTLLDTKRNIILYQGIGKACGIEYGGEQMNLIDQ